MVKASFRGHLLPALGGAVAASVILMAGDIIKQTYFPPDPDEWFEVENLVVEDHIIGEDRDDLVCITSTIRQAFRSKFVVSLREILSNGEEAPRGQAEHPTGWDYNIKAQSRPCFSWKEYTLMEGIKNPGVYYIAVSWPMFADDGERRVQRINSNLFGVTP